MEGSTVPPQALDTAGYVGALRDSVARRRILISFGTMTVKAAIRDRLESTGSNAETLRDLEHSADNGQRRDAAFMLLIGRRKDAVSGGQRPALSQASVGYDRHSTTGCERA